MPQVLFAMHAPDGSCTLSLRSSQNARLANYFVTLGSIDEWQETIGSSLGFTAANNDSSKHLWIDCDLIVGEGGSGELWVEVHGNAASMWVSVDDGEHVVVSTNFPPRDREKLAYRFGRFLLPRPGAAVDSRYIKDVLPQTGK